MSKAHRTAVSRAGFSLLELLLVMVLAGLLGAAIVSFGPLDRFGLTRAARLAEAHLVRARLHAMSSHFPTQVTLSGTRLELSANGAVLSRVELADAGLGRLDSVAIRPSRLRFNARGHGSAGSVYLYRGRRGVRIVSNFVGRVRVVPFRT